LFTISKLIDERVRVDPNPATGLHVSYEEYLAFAKELDFAFLENIGVSYESLEQSDEVYPVTVEARVNYKSGRRRTDFHY